MKKFIYIANWKAYLSNTQAHDYARTHQAALATLAKTHTMVICPSYDALSLMYSELKESQIALGGQNCSAHKAGPYTGQILAESLAQIGCGYCIVGHTEVRKECPESSALIAAQLSRLLENNITPILCIGESSNEYESSVTTQVLEQQLSPLNQIKALVQGKTIAIAYEPLWTIQSNSIPQMDYLQQQVNTIKRILAQSIPLAEPLIFYGGNVNEFTIKPLKDSGLLNGVLIGRASTDFQKFQKIVLS